MSKRSSISLSAAGIAAAILLLAPLHGGAHAAEPAGLGMRFLEVTDGADPFSPLHQDGRADASTLRAVIAVGPVGPQDRQDGPDPMRRDLERRPIAVQLVWTVQSPGGATVFESALEAPLAAPLDIVRLPVDGGGTAPFARVAAEVVWDGRDEAGAYVADGEYPYDVRARLILSLPDAADVGGRTAEAAGSVTVDNTAPAIEPVFPLPVSLTDARQVTARFRASDASGLAAVGMNGLPASGGGNTHEWSATVSLIRGDNDLIASAEDAAGNRTEATIARVRSEEALLYAPYPILYDAPRHRALIGEVGSDTLVVVDLDGGARSVLSGAGVGDGPALPNPSRIMLDDSRDRVLVYGTRPASGGDGFLVAVDPLTGDRTMISDPAVSGGPAIGHGVDAAIDPAHDRVLVCDDYGDAVVGIDLATGERSIVSGASAGSGAVLDNPRSLAVDAAHGIAYVSRVLPDDALLAVDLETGDRTLVASGSPSLPITWFLQDLSIDPVTGLLLAIDAQGRARSFDPDTGDLQVVFDPPPGPAPRQPIEHAIRGMAVDGTGRFLLSDSQSPSVFGVDRATGAWTLLSGGGVGEGPVLLVSSSNDLAIDPQRPVIYYTESGLAGSVWRIDPRTGRREHVSSGAVGTGPALMRAEGIDWEPLSDTLLVTDSSARVLLRVDPRTGDRAVISGSGTGAGVPFTGPGTVSLDPGAPRAVVDDRNVLRVVDLASGDRSIAAGAGTGGIPNTVLEGLGWHPATGEILTGGWAGAGIDGSLLAIDPVSGSSRVIAGTSTGGGPAFDRFLDLAVDGVRQVAYVLDDAFDGVVAVSLPTGDRRYLSGNGVGAGPRLDARSIALDAEHGIAFVINAETPEIIAIDIVSGDRVIVAR